MACPYITLVVERDVKTTFDAKLSITNASDVLIGIYNNILKRKELDD